jgi:hypothetical protein
MVVELLAIGGCASSISVNTDYDKSYQFSKLKTFLIQLGPSKSGTIAGTSPLVVQRVAAAIETQLKSKGFTPAEGEVDFIAVAHGGSQEKVGVEEWGYGGWWGAGNVDVYNYKEGSLVIDMVDYATKKAIWRGVGEGIVGDKAPDEAKVNEVVAKVLQGFPPAASTM